MQQLGDGTSDEDWPNVVGEAKTGLEYVIMRNYVSI